MKPLVGVASPAFLFENENTNLDVYRFSNNYGKRIYDAGGIPVGILPDDGRVPDGVLDRMDAFVICGGQQMWQHHYQVVDHAVKTGKPLLGICLGMQTIYRYFKLVDHAKEIGYDGDIWELHEQVRGSEITALPAVQGHHGTLVRGREDEIKHRVNLVEGSHIARLVGADYLYAATLHNYCAGTPSPQTLVTGRAEDGTIEVIEHGDRILGVQFHPEVDDKLLPLFSFLVK